MQSHNLKEIAARYAVNNFIKPLMNVGLGTGSTAAYAVTALSERIRAEGLIVGKLVATSSETADLALFHGLTVEQDLTSGVPVLDVTIDGADEVDPNLNLVKGGGGALMREKLVAAHTKREVIIVDDSKVVQTLGLLHPLPVMVVPYGYQTTAARIADVIGRFPAARLTHTGDIFVSNDGLYCLDVPAGPIDDPAKLEAAIKAVTGVVDVGLFVGMTQTLVVADANGDVVVTER